jgi:hypothetical protein
VNKSIITIRASAFGSFFDCGARFEFEHLQGKSRPSSLRAHLGTSIHAGAAAFDQAVLDGAPISANDAAGAMMDVWYSPSGDVDLRDDKLSLKEAERIALTLLTKYCTQIAPTMQYEAVEMSLLPLEIDCDDGLIIKLTGTMDRARVVRGHDGHVINDVKTGSRIISDGAVNVRKHLPQLGTYEILYTHTTGQTTAGGQITGLQTTAKCETGISGVVDAKKLMLGDEESPGLIQMAATAMKSGLFMPNNQSALCSERYCARWGSCRYHA